MVGRCIDLYRSVYLTNLLRGVSLFGDGVWIPVALVVVAAALILFLKKDRLFAAVLLVAPLVGNLVKYGLKHLYTVPRPGAFGCPVLTNFADKHAFPSGHTIFYTIFFGLLTYYSAKHWRELWAKTLLPVSIILILTIGYSRIYLGAHWYLDVIAGYIIGGAILVIAAILYKYFCGVKNG